MPADKSRHTISIRRSISHMLEMCHRKCLTLSSVWNLNNAWTVRMLHIRLLVHICRKYPQVRFFASALRFPLKQSDATLSLLNHAAHSLLRTNTFTKDWRGPGLVKVAIRRRKTFSLSGCISASNIWDTAREVKDGWYDNLIWVLFYKINMVDDCLYSLLIFEAIMSLLQNLVDLIIEPQMTRMSCMG